MCLLCPACAVVHMLGASRYLLEWARMFGARPTGADLNAQLFIFYLYNPLFYLLAKVELERGVGRKFESKKCGLGFAFGWRLDSRPRLERAYTLLSQVPGL